MRRTRDWSERVLGGPVVWAGLAMLTVFAIAPFVWVFLASFKTRAELYATPIVYLPASFSVVNYVHLHSSPASSATICASEVQSIVLRPFATPANKR